MQKVLIFAGIGQELRVEAQGALRSALVLSTILQGRLPPVW